MRDEELWGRNGGLLSGKTGEVGMSGSKGCLGETDDWRAQGSGGVAGAHLTGTAEGEVPAQMEGWGCLGKLGGCLRRDGGCRRVKGKDLGTVRGRENVEFLERTGSRLLRRGDRGVSGRDGLPRLGRSGLRGRWKRAGQGCGPAPPPPGSPKKGGRWDTASRKGPVSICLSAGSGFSRCSASSAISGSRPAVMPQPAPRASTPPLRPPPSALGPSLPPAVGSGDASVATSARAAPE